MSTAALFLISGAIVVLLVRLVTRRRGQPQPFTGGRAGGRVVEIPGSSGALHAELLTAAEPYMGLQNKFEFSAISALVNSNLHAEAIGKIDQALASKPPADYEVLLLWIKSNVCQRAGEIEEEIAVLQMLCTLRSNRMFEMNLGNAYAKIGDYEAAKDRFETAISLANGGYPLARYNLGCLYCKMKRREDAGVQLTALENSTERVPAGLLDRLRLRISELS